MSNEVIDSNQTQFSDQGPLLSLGDSGVDIDAHEPVTPVPWFRQRRWLLTIAILALGLVLLLALALQPRRRENSPVDVQVTPTPAANLNPYEARIKALETELDSADPAKQELPFPAVNMTLDIPDDKQFR